MSGELVVFCTTPNANLAKEIAESLVRDNLAACCNIIPGVNSVYLWHDEIQHDSEHLMLIKTSAEKFEEVEQRIKELHTYEVPEIIALEIKQGSHEYINWLHQVVNNARR